MDKKYTIFFTHICITLSTVTSSHSFEFLSSIIFILPEQVCLTFLQGRSVGGKFSQLCSV